MTYRGEGLLGYRSMNLRGLLRLQHTRRSPGQGRLAGASRLSKGCRDHPDARKLARIWLPSREGRPREHVRAAPLIDANIRHVQPVGHPLLEAPDDMRLAPRDRDRQHIAFGGPELDDIAVVLRAVDHDAVLTGHHSNNHNKSSPTVPPTMAARRT
jgi:hypothetical protein